MGRLILGALILCCVASVPAQRWRERNLQNADDSIGTNWQVKKAFTRRTPQWPFVGCYPVLATDVASIDTRVQAIHTLLLPNAPGLNGSYQILNWGLGNGYNYNKQQITVPHFQNGTKGVQLDIGIINDPGKDNWSCIDNLGSFPSFRMMALEDPSVNCTIFCGGQILLPSLDPTVVVFGGTTRTSYDDPTSDNKGVKCIWRFQSSKQANVYSPLNIAGASNQASLPWRFLGNMSYARYYPTAITLPSGRQLVIGGSTEVGPAPINTVRSTMLYSNEPYGPLNSTGGAPYITHYAAEVPWPSNTTNYAYFDYPFLYTWGGSQWKNQLLIVNPDGTTQKLDLATMQYTALTGGMTESDDVMNRYPSVAMFDGKVLKSGGTPNNDPVTPASPDSSIFDMNSSNPAWADGGNLAVPRTNHSCVVLPDKKMMVFSGNQRDLMEFASGYPERNPEMYDPSTNQFTLMNGSGQRSYVSRGYHNTAALLPDGRVWVSGGNMFSQNAEPFWTNRDLCWWPQIRFEMWEPKYYTLSRPVLTTAITDNQSVYFDEPLPANIATWPSGTSEGYYCLAGLASATHAMDNRARMVTLTKRASDGKWILPSAEQAPPGWYMLFAVSSPDANGDRHVSVAKFVRIVERYSQRSPYALSVEGGSFDDSGDATVPIVSVSAVNRHLGAVIQADGYDGANGYRTGYLRIRKTGSAGNLTLRFRTHFPWSTVLNQGMRLRLETRRSSNGTWEAPIISWNRLDANGNSLGVAQLNAALTAPLTSDRQDIFTNIKSTASGGVPAGSSPAGGNNEFTITWPNVPLNGYVDIDELNIGGYQGTAE